MAYIIKTFLCSGLLYVAYLLFLQQEKMLRFNRAYLLGSLVVSMLAPLIMVRSEMISLPIMELMQVASTPPPSGIVMSGAPAASHENLLPIAAWTIYLAVTALFLVRLTRNLLMLTLHIRKSHRESWQGARLVYGQHNSVPYSFLRYIFLDKEEMESGKIEKEILYHELAHVRQWHSIDVLFLELLITFSWFNPFLYLYCRSVKLNHEFLADASVIREFTNTGYYQQLLITKASVPVQAILSSPFNYFNTKKRLLMMTRKTSSGMAFCKQAAAISLLLAGGFVFSTRLAAQETPKVLPKQQMPSTVEGASSQLMGEYESIINKYRSDDKKWRAHFLQTITDADRDRLETIFKQMSREQQSKQTVAFMPPIPPLPKVVPTESQLNAWKNAAQYGIWINNKKVSNAVLNNYSPIDFEQVFVSKLSKNAINYGKYYYQVDLMTKSFYEDYYNKAIADKRNRLIFQTFRFRVHKD